MGAVTPQVRKVRRALPGVRATTQYLRGLAGECDDRSDAGWLHAAATLIDDQARELKELRAELTRVARAASRPPKETRHAKAKEPRAT